MKRLFKNQDPILLTVIFSIAFCVVISLCLIPLYFNGWMNIPNGIAIGFIINILSYLATYLVKPIEERTKTLKYSILITIARFVLLVGAVIAFSVLEYKFEIKIANPIAIVGGYILTLVINIICIVLERKMNVR